MGCLKESCHYFWGLLALLLGIISLSLDDLSDYTISLSTCDMSCGYKEISYDCIDTTFSYSEQNTSTYDSILAAGYGWLAFTIIGLIVGIGVMFFYLIFHCNQKQNYHYMKLTIGTVISALCFLIAYISWSVGGCQAHETDLEDGYNTGSFSTGSSQVLNMIAFIFLIIDAFIIGCNGYQPQPKIIAPITTTTTVSHVVVAPPIQNNNVMITSQPTMQYYNGMQYQPQPQPQPYIQQPNYGMMLMQQPQQGQQQYVQSQTPQYIPMQQYNNNMVPMQQQPQQQQPYAPVQQYNNNPQQSQPIVYSAPPLEKEGGGGETEGNTIR